MLLYSDLDRHYFKVNYYYIFLCKSNTSSYAVIKKWPFIKALRRQMWFYPFAFFFSFPQRQLLSYGSYESSRNRSQKNHPAYFLKQMPIWWNSATADKVWAILGDVLHGCKALILFSFDKHRRQILDLVSSVHLLVFERSTEAGHRMDRPRTQLENQHWESEQYIYHRVSEQVSTPHWLLLKKAQLASIGWADYHKGALRWFFFSSLLFPWAVPDPKIAFLHKG